MNKQDILAALAAARNYKPEQKESNINPLPIRDENSFVTIYDQLEQLDQNPFNINNRNT